jgi:hypothetical protein
MRRWAAGLAVASVLVLVACGDDGDPDPGGRGNDHTEVDGGETDAGVSSTTVGSGGGGTGGATQGNQQLPGETPATAQNNG